MASPISPGTQPPQERPGAECRLYERVRCDLPATCQPASALEMKEMRWGATITDISQGGVRIILPRRFEKGTGLALELPGDRERESSVVFVKVMHVRRLDDGTYTLGCKFISELSEDEMRRLLTSTHHVLSSEKEHPGHNERDEDGNVPEMPANRNLTDVHLLVESTPGSVVECRIKRLNVTNCWPLTPGKILSMRGKTDEQAAWSARIQIVEFTPHAKGCEIRGRSIEQS